MLWMVTQDEHVGFDKQQRRLGTFAIMCQLIIHAKTLGDALELSSQFYKLFGDEWSVTLERDKHEARLVPLIPNAMDPDHFITESMLMIWHGSLNVACHWNACILAIHVQPMPMNMMPCSLRR